MDDSFLFSLTRRKFLASSTVLMSGLLFDIPVASAGFQGANSEKEALPLHHFPSTLHALLWRNWCLVPLERMARVVKATPENLLAIGTSMGLPSQVKTPEYVQRSSYLSIIRRNLHLLPRKQLRELLGWADGLLSFSLQEDGCY